MLPYSHHTILYTTLHYYTMLHPASHWPRSSQSIKSIRQSIISLSPHSLRVQIENEKTQLQISEQEQHVAEKRAETKRKEASIRAQAELEVAEIQLKIQIGNQEAK